MERQMRTPFLVVAIASLLLPQPVLSAEKAEKLPKADAAFIAEYKKLQKKYPGASRSFLLTYRPSGQRGVADLCAWPCHAAGYGDCRCPGQELKQ
ncbi:MAG TPA: hypothetical protein VFZ16_04225 [Hyphomicrobiaceae bacterium]|nr:hypothetical protein [Hyphomicrobiaceae bacterium]